MDLFDHSFRTGVMTILVVVLVSLPGMTPAQSRPPDMEEIVIGFDIPRLVQKDIFILYDGETVYLPVVRILKTLEVPVEVDIKAGRFTGHYLQPSNKYEIDALKSYARCFGKEFILEPNTYMLKEADLYLRMDEFSEIFQLPFVFNFSELSVRLPLNDDFPAYQKLKRKAAHEKLLRKETATRDVQPLPRKFKYVGGAVADWTISASPVGGSHVHYFSLGLGSMLMGGDLTVTASGNTRSGLLPSQSRARWHYYFEDNPYVSQIALGDIGTAGSFARSMRGLLVTNSPQIQRRYFQTIEIADQIGEGWEIELYVNNTLADVAYTDNTGVYSFLVDVYYGSTQVTLKMYGPNGELETKEYYTRVPYNLIPKGQVEYTLAGGISRYNPKGEPFVQGNSYFGIRNNLTVGLSAEAPFTPSDSGKTAMAAELNYQPFGSLIVGGSLSPGNDVTVNASFSEPRYLNASGSFTRFFSPPPGSRLLPIDKLSLSASSPLRIGNQFFGLRFHLTMDRFVGQKALNASYGMNLPAGFLYFNYTGRYKRKTIAQRITSEVSSQIIASLRTLSWINPQARFDYDHTNAQIIKYGLLFTRRVFRTGQLSLGLDRNVLSQSYSVSITFNLFNDYASFTTRGLYSNSQLGIIQTQTGSLLYDQEARRVLFDRRRRVGSGSAMLRPFLDENYNGVYDNGEEYITGLRAKITGVGGRPHGKGRHFYYDQLHAYDNYIVQIDPYSLDNPLLKPAHDSYSVQVNPNMVTTIEVPLVTASEINGSVTRQVGSNQAGVGGIRIIIINTSKDVTTEITSFADGEYYYLGLLPGVYRAYVDPSQLKELGYRVEPEAREFIIKPVEGGSIIENMDFVLYEQ